MPNPLTWDDELNELLDDIECRELSEMKAVGRIDRNSHAAGFSVGVLETVEKIREWLNG